MSLLPWNYGVKRGLDEETECPEEVLSALAVELLKRRWCQSVIVTFLSRLALIASAAFIIVFQIRYSIATLEARSTFLFIPFQVEQCTDTIESVGQPAKGVLRSGDKLIAVNGRPFTGMSVYRQELRTATRYLDAVNRRPEKDLAEALSRWPFSVTVRSGPGEARTVEVNFAHCTCGSLDIFQVVWYCILPPTICMLLGLVVAVYSRLRSALPWLLLAVVVCVSLVPLVPEWSSSWSQVADPLEWRDWFRIPALAYQSFFRASWSAWLLMFAVYCFRKNVKVLTAWWAVAPILAVAVLKTVVSIGSAESYRVVAPLHRVLESASTGISVMLFFCTALVTWSFGRRWVLVSAILATCAAIALCWPASVPEFHVTRMDDDIAYYRTSDVVGTCFTAAVLLVVIVAGWSSLVASAKHRRRPTGELFAIFSMVLLLVPFMYSALSGVVALWWMRFVPQGVLICLYAGLLGVAWVVLSACRARTSPGTTMQF